MVLLDFIGTNDFALIARKARHAINILEPVQFLVRGSKPQAAAAVPGYGLSRELFQLWIKLGAIEMHLGHVERAIELRALARRVPSGARSQFTLFDEHNIAPAFQRQVIKQANAHHAATNHNHPCMGLHSIPPRHKSV